MRARRVRVGARPHYGGAGARGADSDARQGGGAVRQPDVRLPPVPFSGAVGEVVYRITFAPDGAFVSAETEQAGGPLDRSVRAVIGRCRAEPLPTAAVQINQTTEATFRFRAQ